MGDGILICEGKSNKDWNYSVMYGVDIVLSRMQAKNMIEMKDIYSSSVCEYTLDEAPQAYRIQKR